MTAIDSKVLSIEPLSPFVLKIVLDVQQFVPFKAGQYLQVVMSENDKRPFSIANMPGNDGLLELHIGASPLNPYAFEVVEKAKLEQVLSVEVGLGEAFLRDSELPLILIAGGTGYSYTKSILLDCLRSQVKRKVYLYWGAKTSADLYEAAQLTLLAQAHEQFSFVPVVENTESGWLGKTGFVHSAVISDFKSFEGTQVYVAGRFEMSAAIREAFLPLGLSKEHLFGDAFAFI